MERANKGKNWGLPKLKPLPISNCPCSRQLYFFVILSYLFWHWINWYITPSVNCQCSAEEEQGLGRLGADILEVPHGSFYTQGNYWQKVGCISNCPAAWCQNNVLFPSKVWHWCWALVTRISRMVFIYVIPASWFPNFRQVCCALCFYWCSLAYLNKINQCISATHDWPREAFNCIFLLLAGCILFYLFNLCFAQ